MNSIILFSTLVLVFGATLLGYALFGKTGLYCVSVLATVLANIEVVMMIKAFGMEQTLGNVLFAVTFLATDILSECEGKREANKAVWLGVFSTLFFLALSQSWLLYTPTADAAATYDAFSVIFAQTPRVVIASLTIYAVSQLFDVWIYHKWWSFTENKTGDKRPFLWLRNNGSTLISQLLNTVLFNILAFAGVFDFSTMLSVIASGYLIYVCTSLLDTPVIYLARRIHDKKIAQQKT